MPYLVAIFGLLTVGVVALLALKIGKMKKEDLGNNLAYDSFMGKLPVDSPEVLAKPFLELWGGLDPAAQNQLKDEIKKYGWEAYFLTDLRSRERVKQLDAIEILGFIGGEKSFWPLMDALASKDDEISFSGTAALKKLETPSMVENLVNAFREPGKWPPARIAEILIEKDSVLDPFLLKELNEGNEQSRKLVNELLEEIGTQREGYKNVL